MRKDPDGAKQRIRIMQHDTITQWGTGRSVHSCNPAHNRLHFDNPMVILANRAQRTRVGVFLQQPFCAPLDFVDVVGGGPCEDRVQRGWHPEWRVLVSTSTTQTCRDGSS